MQPPTLKCAGMWANPEPSNEAARWHPAGAFDAAPGNINIRQRARTAHTTTQLGSVIQYHPADQPLPVQPKPSGHSSQKPQRRRDNCTHKQTRNKGYGMHAQVIWAQC
jgi:hypothetical protein